MLKDNLHYRRGMYCNGANQSTDLVELLLQMDEVKINTKYLDPKFVPAPYDSPFEGVRMLEPYDIIHTNYTYLLSMNRTYDGTLAQYIKNIRIALRMYWESVIKPGEKYLVFHSAGFDSRIISLTLMEYRIKHGTESTKNIHFRCHQPEGLMFIEIMERQNWDKNQYSVYTGPSNDYYNIGLKDLPLNGWQNYNQQMNFWADIVPPQAEKEYNLITGVGGELFKFIAQEKNRQAKHNTTPFYLKNQEGPTQCTNHHFNLLLNRYPFNGEWEGYWRKTFKELYLPFYSYLYLYFSVCAPPKFCTFDGERDSIRTAIVQSYIRTHNVDCLNIKYGHHNYSWLLSDKRKNQMLNDFYTSMFYTDHKSYFENIPQFDFFKNMYAWPAKIWSLMTVYDYVKSKCKHELIDITTRADSYEMFLCNKCGKITEGNKKV